MDIPVEYSGEMDGPPPHEQARRPECTAPRYINDVTAGEIYESRVSSAPIPASKTIHIARLLQSTCKALTRGERRRACTG